MTLNPELIDVGDIVTRYGADRHRVSKTNQGNAPLSHVDLLEIICLDSAGEPWCAPGDTELVVPDGWRLVQRAKK